ncbi:MAG TPA: hypothetical protein VK588_11350 [Chitinophagaceae bacterium]|nr:hypothetical protein [Chitinophagaceae bacterium]
MSEINKTALEVVSRLLNNNFYIVIETEYTKHHIERLMPTCKDRGRFKWIAETKGEAYGAKGLKKEARFSHIDNADLFPRLYFRDESLINEISDWLKMRNLIIINVELPNI